MHQIETKVFTKGIQESSSQFVFFFFFFFFFFAFNSHHDVSHFLTLNLSGLLYYCSVWPWPPFPFIICLNYQQTKIYTICFLNLSFSFFFLGFWYFIVLYQAKLNVACIKCRNRLNMGQGLMGLQCGFFFFFFFEKQPIVSLNILVHNL